MTFFNAITTGSLTRERIKVVQGTLGLVRGIVKFSYFTFFFYFYI